jgi:hypothetical protein
MGSKRGLRSLSYPETQAAPWFPSRLDFYFGQVWSMTAPTVDYLLADAASVADAGDVNRFEYFRGC